MLISTSLWPILIKYTPSFNFRVRETLSDDRRNADSRGRETFRRPLSPFSILSFELRSLHSTSLLPNSGSVLKF
jgi:hypothetical protein